MNPNSVCNVTLNVTELIILLALEGDAGTNAMLHRLQSVAQILDDDPIHLFWLIGAEHEGPKWVVQVL